MFRSSSTMSTVAAMTGKLTADGAGEGKALTGVANGAI
jgi:hypothetical protein